MTICSSSDNDNQSDSVVGQTLWETTDCWLQTYEGRSIGAEVAHFIIIIIYYHLFHWLSDTHCIDNWKNAKYRPGR